MIIDIKELKDIAEIEFRDIVELVIVTDINQLRRQFYRYMVFSQIEK